MLPSFVPPGYDEAEVDSLYSYLKPKEVDSTQYERKIEFFSKCIDHYLQSAKSVMVSYYDLEVKLQNGDRVPAPLYGTLTELYRKGTIKSPGELEKGSGWLAWGASWLNPFGGAKEVQKNDQFVHIPTLKILGKDLVKLHQSLINDDDDHPEVIGFNDFQQAARSVVADAASFKYAIEDLEREGILTTGTSQTGERVIKFRTDAKAPVQFTSVDASVHELRRQMKKLKFEISKMEQKEEALKASAKAAVQQNNKSLALQHLRRKKQIDKELEMRENAYDKLRAMLDNLYQMKQSKEVVDAYKLGNKAFKATLEEHGLNPDDVDQTIEDVRSTMDDFNEINDLLGARDGPSSVDEADLEAEFSAIVAEEKLAERNNRVIVNKNIIDLGGLPEIPSDNLPIATPSKTSDSLEERMRRLREAA